MARHEASPAPVCQFPIHAMVPVQVWVWYRQAYDVAVAAYHRALGIRTPSNVLEARMRVGAAQTRFAVMVGERGRRGLLTGLENPIRFALYTRDALALSDMARWLNDQDASGDWEPLLGPVASVAPANDTGVTRAA